MKVVLQDKNYFVLRFDKDEEVLAGIEKFMTDRAVSACVFFGLGACSNAEISHYNSHMKEYRAKPFYEDLEIVSFSGNGALMEGKPALHAHGSFGRNDFSVIAGHINKMTVSAICEIFLTKLEAPLQRTHDANLNLNLLT
jgi:uncharacterized protein